MATVSDEEFRFVVMHPRFRGLGPARGKPRQYVVRIADDGHEIHLVGPIDAVIRAAAEALRRTA